MKIYRDGNNEKLVESIFEAGGDLDKNEQDMDWKFIRGEALRIYGSGITHNFGRAVAEAEAIASYHLQMKTEWQKDIRGKIAKILREVELEPNTYFIEVGAKTNNELVAREKIDITNEVQKTVIEVKKQLATILLNNLFSRVKKKGKNNE